MTRSTTLPLTLAALAWLALSACADEPTRPTAAREPQETAARAAPAFAVSIRDLGTLGGRQSRAIGLSTTGPRAQTASAAAVSALRAGIARHWAIRRP